MVDAASNWARSSSDSAHTWYVHYLYFLLYSQTKSLLLAPQFGYGMRVIQGGLHPCTCMKFLCNMDEGTLSIDDMDDDFHLQSCPPITPTASSPLLMPVPLGLGVLSAPLSTSSTVPASRTSYTSAPPSTLARRRRSPSIDVSLCLTMFISMYLSFKI